jgi:hypothetical protein
MMIVTAKEQSQTLAKTNRWLEDLRTLTLETESPLGAMPVTPHIIDFTEHCMDRDEPRIVEEPGNECRR